MILFLSLFACPKPSPVISETEKSLPQKEVIFDDPQLNSGVHQDGEFSDYVFPFTARIPDDWIILPQPKFFSCRLKLQHKIDPILIEVWRFREISTKPVMHDFCEWSFVDRGIYDRSPSKDLVATCIPRDAISPYVFAYIRHWKGTWQFEIHVSQEDYINGKHKAEKLLNHFYWNDGEPIPVRKP